MLEILEKKGFFILNNVVTQSRVVDIILNLKKKIDINAEEINTSSSNYIYCTGRWGPSSNIIKCIDNSLDNIIQIKLEKILKKKIKLQKKNIICKNKDIREAVPLHQDISYSPNSPYHFSLWLALDNVDNETGALQFIPKSHKLPIQPAVDFWSPSYISSKKCNKTTIKVIELKKGDAVIFDSRLWHGSLKSLSGKDRHAYVTRWEILDFGFPNIPKIKPEYFGMWNCHDITINILRSSLKNLNHTICDNDDFVTLINKWKNIIQSDHISNINKNKANEDLENVSILYKAATKHDAGDLTGKIYKNLWYSLLSYL
ncbi:phytanoyl-CoA dioxygenase family protein [Candidatus Bandiella numerosa]|uniref:phytanoyl-CoA dioxygenase family protein n=1 Tax=Candidatus Bandiella numerosa TaxID=2570586 RepID=UPI00249F3B35|nr:phytanoyl-CoA dioxygenase family protein [Candidatus Bandiella numerosa]WHA04480.1 phytanoyl-CoA dioxygenase family protein [Candidatus Bandiella numerosa]